jgi:hypothetical protein
MMRAWRQSLAFVLFAASCSLEPNPSPYPMPGGADIGQPIRPDANAGSADSASAPDVTSPNFDVNVGEDASVADAADGSEEDAEDLDAADDAETSLDFDVVDDTSDVEETDSLTDMDVESELDAVDDVLAPDGDTDDADALDESGDAAISVLDVQSRVVPD